MVDSDSELFWSPAACAFEVSLYHHVLEVFLRTPFLLPGCLRLAA